MIKSYETPPNQQTEFKSQPDNDPPQWYQEFAAEVATKNITDVVGELANMNFTQLQAKMGGDIKDLPYELLQVVFPDGSENEEVAQFLREKRESYLKEHPEEAQGRGAANGIIGYDGRFYSYEYLKELKPADMFVILVGTTCFHYNSDTPGYGDDDERSEQSKI